MKWLASALAVVLVSAVAYSQQQNTGTKPVLKSGDKCTADGGCVCGDPPIDVKKGCECQISLGSGTQHCPVGEGGGPKPLTSVVWGVIGAVLGSGLTFLAMRGRSPA